MGYVVLQKSLEPPAMEQLAVAFRGVPGLTPADAAMMCRHSLGILVRGVGEAEARQIQGGLAAQGVETEIAEQGSLPVLPPMRHVTRLECKLDALELFDPLGRPFPLPWDDIMMIAAGRVGVTEFTRTPVRPSASEASSGLGAMDNMLFKNSGLSGMARKQVNVATRCETTEEHHQTWMAEIVIRGAGLRYNVEANNAVVPLFSYLGERRTDDLTRNFQLLVQDMCQNAPQATINRGAYYLREGNPSAYAYPGKNIFYDEMTWLLWRQARPQI